MPQSEDVADRTVVLRASRIVKHYTAPSGETQALRGVEVALVGGTVTAVTGPSGSGKSSLLAIAALRERATGGELEVCGASISALSLRRLAEVRRRCVAWVAQLPAESLFPQLTAREQLLQVAASRHADRAESLGALERLGLADRADSLVGRLSGGEQQRLAVGMAAVARRSLVVADEPTAELDDEAAALVLTELARCAAEGAAVLVATHDERVHARVDRVLALRHGVLSTEREAGGAALAPIDSAGRLQLPRDALALFPDGRALIELDGQQVILRRPADGAPS